jgi:hypothetical protein
MDILNWLYVKTAGLVRTTANNPDTDLIALGANVGFNKRDDQYQTYAMPLKDAVQAGLPANTAHYELDIAATNVVTVSTPRGIIDILNMGTTVPLTPSPTFATSTPFFINNPELDLTVANRDNVYVQYSLYYSSGISDPVIPYLISTGMITPGLGFNLFNASSVLPLLPGDNPWTGALYVYYELYQIN